MKAFSTAGCRSPGGTGPGPARASSTGSRSPTTSCCGSCTTPAPRAFTFGRHRDLRLPGGSCPAPSCRGRNGSPSSPAPTPDTSPWTSTTRTAHGFGATTTAAFLERIDPAIKHAAISAADVRASNTEAGAGNDNPDHKWCTGRATLICIQSTYKLEGKIPIGIMLVNKLRDSVKKVSDHIEFQSESSALPAADLDQAGLQQLTALNTPIAGVLEQDRSTSTKS